jgi:uroporphyrinogen-III synthase
MSNPLAGYRVLVTRAQHQASQLATQLQAAGAETISIPTIEIVPPQDWGPLDLALLNIKDFDWLVLTSANAVQSLQQRMEILHLSPQDFADVKIAVIGPATAHAAEDIALRITLMPSEAVAEKLAEILRPHVADKNVLLSQARVARDVLALELQRAGAKLTVVEAYQNVVPAESADLLRAAFVNASHRPHAIVFTSSSTAQNFFQLIQQSGLTLPSGTVLASIGPVTSQTLREHGFAPDIEAEEHNIPGLVKALSQHFGSKP